MCSGQAFFLATQYDVTSFVEDATRLVLDVGRRVQAPASRDGLTGDGCMDGWMERKDGWIVAKSLSASPPISGDPPRCKVSAVARRLRRLSCPSTKVLLGQTWQTPTEVRLSPAAVYG